MADELKVLQDYQDFSVQLLRRTAAFPRNFRHGLGRSMERRAEDVLALLIRAKYAPRDEKGHILREVNVELEVLRFQVRQAVDLRAMAMSHQETLLETLRDVGRQVGGWRKSTAGHQPDPPRNA